MPEQVLTNCSCDIELILLATYAMVVFWEIHTMYTIIYPTLNLRNYRVIWYTHESIFTNNAKVIQTFCLGSQIVKTWLDLLNIVLFLVKETLWDCIYTIPLLICDRFSQSWKYSNTNVNFLVCFQVVAMLTNFILVLPYINICFKCFKRAIKRVNMSSVSIYQPKDSIY